MGNVTLGLVMFLVMFLAITVFVLPLAFGWRLVVVLSGSMEPALPVGALIVTEPVDPAHVSVGDIIFYRAPIEPDVMITHRVVEVLDGDSPGFRTQGDANEEEDNFIVPAENATGRVRLSVPRVGYILSHTGQFVRTRLGLGLLMGLPAGLLIAMEIKNLFLLLGPGQTRARRRQRRREWLKRSGLA